MNPNSEVQQRLEHIREKRRQEENQLICVIESYLQRKLNSDEIQMAKNCRQKTGFQREQLDAAIQLLLKLLKLPKKQTKEIEEEEEIVVEKNRDGQRKLQPVEKEEEKEVEDK